MSVKEKIGAAFVLLMAIGMVAVVLFERMPNVPLIVYSVCIGLPFLAVIWMLSKM